MRRFFSFFQKRRFQMRETAQRLGMDFQETDEYGLIAMMKEFKLFKRGYGKKITNIISNKRDIEHADFRIFDYKYVIGGGNSTRAIHQTVFYVHSKKLNLPHLLLKPEGFFSRVNEYFGSQDIDFQAFPVFSKQYTLQGDEPQVRDVMKDHILHFFTIEKDWSLEGLNYLLILYIKNQRFSPEQIEGFYQKGLEVFQLFAEEG